MTYLDGQLVSVSYGGKGGTLSLTRLTSNSVPGALKVGDQTLGSKALADTVHIYDRVGRSPIVEVSLSDIPFLTVDAKDISYARINYAGKIDLIVLDDVTGDAYDYGIVSSTKVENYNDQNPSQLDSVSYTTVFYNSNPDKRVEVSSTYTNSSSVGTPGTSIPGQPNVTSGTFVGWAVANSASGSMTIAGTVNLTATVGFTRQAIDSASNSLTVNGMTLPISSDVQCYNKRTGGWFGSLNELMSSSNSFTAYYDRSPNEGGKVRVIVAN